MTSQMPSTNSRTHALHEAETDKSSIKSSDTTEYIGNPKLIAIIGDEDTCVGFILAGIGELDKYQEPNYFVVDQKTDNFELELAFLDFLERPDIGMVLITREAVQKIAPIVNLHNGMEPTVMIIPGHNGPYELDMPLAVQYIEERRMSSNGLQHHKKGSASNTSLRSSVDIHIPSKKVSTHSLRSCLSSNLNNKY